MTRPEPDQDKSTPPTPDGPGRSDDPERTLSYSGSESPATDGASAGVASQFDFLEPPQAEGELGRLAHYRVRRLIGEGSIGLVFLAEDTHLARDVALKVIRPEKADSPEIRGRFVREAQATAAIKHDHIVTIYQVGRDNGILFLAMEYLQGVSLQGWLDRGRKPSTDLVLRIGREIASGLSAAHRNGLVHRDVKPANIWLESPSARVKILDFGMARSERDETQITHAGTVMGTPAYMAPEQARGEVAAAGSDLFSLGCILYRLCSGRSPFDGPTILAVLSSLASETPRSLREIDPSVGPDLDELVMRLLAKDPSARPATAQAVVESIRAIERKSVADRQKVEISADSTRDAAEAVPVPLPVGIDAARLETPPRPRKRRILRGLAAVAGGAAAVGVLLYVQFRESPAVSERRPAPSPSVLAQLSVDRSRELKAVMSPSTPAVQPDRAGPEVAPAATTGKDSPPSESPKPPIAPSEAVPDSGRDSTSQPLPDRRADSLTPRPIGWSKPINPDGDCKFEIDRENNRIGITIPGTPHLLSVELGRLNAPRLLRPVEGDFDASVTVDGVLHVSGRATTKEYAAYQGAGLLLWGDDRNYFRLEIASDIHRGKVRPYANFELRKGGVLTISKGPEIKDASTCLRLERRGNEVRAAFGHDGIRWTRFEPIMVDFEEKLSVGVVAINSASKSLIVRLEGFSVTDRTKAEGREVEGKFQSSRSEPRPPR